jgi:capsule biosynthesis phosphatase
MGINIIIPLGGLGERFKQVGHTKPKPLIKVLGREIICWLLDKLDLTGVKKVIVPYNIELELYRFESFLQHQYPEINFNFIKLDKQTRGACETVLIALNSLVDDELDNNVMCCDGDNFFTENITKHYKKTKCKNAVFYFEDSHKDPIYSYIQVDKPNRNISDIVEKDKISNNACCGVYCFESGTVLKEYSERIINNNITQKGEFYMSTVVKQMILDKHLFTGIKIDSNNFICLGTPLQLKIFCNNVPLNVINYDSHLIDEHDEYQDDTNTDPTKRRICVELDNVLVTHPLIYNDYSTVQPIQENIDFLKYLKQLGHTIIINTSRGMNGKNNNGKVLQTHGKSVYEILEKFNISYDELYFNKPSADFYIDDRAVNCFSNLERELGFYYTKVAARSFNELKGSTIQTRIKNSDDLAGQIHWYKNIPSSIRDLFPLFIRDDGNNKSYEMEDIKGIPLSKQYLGGEMHSELLLRVLEHIEKIHNVPTDYMDDIDIYSNYLDKLEGRYKSYDYSKFIDSEKIYATLLSYFKIYKEEGRGQATIIHGDTVMTNIIIDQFGKIKFIDMRGKQGDIVSIFGDRFYDYGKFYQSLIGYDEILETKPIHHTYKKKLIEEFDKYIILKYGENKLNDIKMITANLLFTLIPLHNNDKCEKYYKLCQNIIAHIK